jgi:monoamine oxidase
MKLKNTKNISIQTKYLIGFCFIFIVIILVIYGIYKYSNKEDENYSEIICIGAGVANAYFCYELRKKNISNSKILVLEKSDRYGGRIKSLSSNIYVQNEPEVGYAELGGMRLFDNGSMPKVFDLLKTFNIETINVPLKDDNNIFYYKGKQIKKSEARVSNGMTVKEFENYSTNNIKNNYPNFNFKDVNDYNEFQNMNIYDFFKKYGKATQEDVDLWMAYSGYDYNLDNVQVSTWIFEKDFYNTNIADLQKYVKNGMILLVKNLFQNSNANIIYNTKATTIVKNKEGYNIINTISSDNIFKQYKCKYLIIGLSSQQFQELNSYSKIPISYPRFKWHQKVFQYHYLKYL